MFNLTRNASFAAAAALFGLVAVATPADATDWRRSVDNHYDAAAAARYVPRGDNPQWTFTLDAVVADMNWRRRTARMLRSLPKPGSDPVVVEAPQLADRPEPLAFRFAF